MHTYCESHGYSDDTLNDTLNALGLVLKMERSNSILMKLEEYVRMTHDDDDMRAVWCTNNILGKQNSFTSNWNSLVQVYGDQTLKNICYHEDFSVTAERIRNSDTARQALIKLTEDCRNYNYGLMILHELISVTAKLIRNRIDTDYVRRFTKYLRELVTNAVKGHLELDSINVDVFNTNPRYFCTNVIRYSLLHISESHPNVPIIFQLLYRFNQDMHLDVPQTMSYNHTPMD